MTTSSKKWIRIISSWERSGLTQREYCDQNNLSLSTFHYWRRKLGNDITTHKSDLVKIKTKSVRVLSTASSFVLDFPSGVKLAIPPDYNPGQLKQLLSDLREVL